MKTAIYCRISQDRSGDGLGVSRQEDDCRALIERRGWTVAGLYVDDDRSAYSGRRRPAYEELLAELKAGMFDAIVAWHPDRLHRSPRELEDFIDLVEASSVAVATVQAGEYDLGTASGRMTARVVGAVARAESEHKSERIKRQREQAASRGEYHGGGRAYGYESDGVTIVPDEAAMIREAAQRVFAGESIRSIAIDWNSRQVPTARGKPWQTTSLRGMIAGPRIAGRRVLRGEDAGPAVWPPIISHDDHLRIVATLGNPRVTTRGRPPTHLLTGMLRCGLCGARLASNTTKARGQRFICNPGPGRPGCGRIAIAAHNVDTLITEAVLTRLDSPTLAHALREDATGNDHGTVNELAALQAQLEALDHDFYVEGLINRKRWLTVTQALEAKTDAIRNTLARQTRTLAIAPYSGPNGALRNAWPDLAIDKQRAILRTLIDHITIKPAVRTGRTFHPDRVDITWIA
jgi:site-specific DNA recombinase